MGGGGERERMRMNENMFLAGIYGKDFRCGQESCFSYMVTEKDVSEGVEV